MATPKDVARAFVAVTVTVLLLGLLGTPALGGVDPRDGRVIGDNGKVVIGETNVSFVNLTGQLMPAGVIQCTGGDVTTNIFFEGPFDTSNYKDALALGSCKIFGPSDVIDVFFLPPELTITTEVNGVDFEWVTRGSEITFKSVTNLQVIEGPLPYNYVTFKLLDSRNVRVDEVNGVPLTDRDVSGSAIGFVTIDTTTMKTGTYTLSIETDPETNNGLDEEGPEVSFEIRSKGITIEANEEEQTVTEDIVLTVSTTPYTDYLLEVTWGPPANVKFGGVALPLIGTTGKDGEADVVATFTETGSYEITATEAIMGTTDSMFVEIVPYETELDVDKDPPVYHIGEKVEIDVSATAGDSITLKIEDALVALGLDIDGDEYSWNTENLAPGSYELSIWVLPFSDPTTDDPPDESLTILLLRGGLFAQPSAGFVVPGDKFTISGVVPGRDFVDILTIAPDGGGGYGLDPTDILQDTGRDAPGLTYETTGVDTDGEFETEKITVNKDADTGTYTILAMNYGRDGEWGTSRESNLLKTISNNYATDLERKTTDQILSIVKDRTIEAPGTDDLFGLTTIDVESGFVTVDELMDVPLGGDLTVTGTTNRQIDTSIVVTVEGIDERTPSLKPKIAKVEENEKIYYNSFEITFATESANIGEYLVTVDDNDGHTASTSLTIVPAEEFLVNVSEARPPESGGAEMNESVAETQEPTPTTQPTMTPVESPATESAAMGPDFLSLGIILLVLWLVIAIMIAVWVYRDATDRGQNGVLWVIIVLILGVVGLLIWLIRRPKTKETL